MFPSKPKVLIMCTDKEFLEAKLIHGFITNVYKDGLVVFEIYPELHSCGSDIFRENVPEELIQGYLDWLNTSLVNYDYVATIKSIDQSTFFPNEVKEYILNNNMLIQRTINSYTTLLWGFIRDILYLWENDTQKRMSAKSAFYQNK